MRLRNLYEDNLSTIVFTFGRFNPPTIGHEILINQVKSVAEQYGADYIIFASQSQDKKKNPLTFTEKVFFMEKMFPGTNFNKDLSLKTPFQALEALGQKYDRAVLVVGSDRVPEFKSRMAPYVEEFGYKDLIVVSAGERDPDADGAEGMSASKARELAMSGDLEQFKKAIPGNDNLASMMYNKVRAGLGIVDKEPEMAESLSEANTVKSAVDAEFNKIVATLADAGIPLTKELNQWRREGGMVNVIDNLIPFINKKFDKMQSYDIDRYLKSADYNNKTQAEKKKLLPALLNIKKAQTVIPEITTQLRILQKDLETAGITEKVSSSLPKKTKIMKMPTPPKAPTADTPDGVDDSGVEISTTQKGNRMVSNGGGDYIFTPKGKLIVFKTPRIGGLVQIHNLQKQTVTVEFDTIINNVSTKQKGTYDMQGNLISADNTSMRSGAVGISQDKDKGDTIDYRLGNDPSTKISANSKTGLKVGS